MVFLHGSLTPECGAALRTAIDAWSAPQPAADGTPDPRTPGQRRHDALHHLADTALARDEVPTTHGSPAKIIVRVDLQTLATALSAPGPAGPAGDAGDPGSARAAGGPEAARQPTSGEPWRAVGRGQPPTRHPSPPELSDGTPLSRQTLARLACTADLVPILIDELGNPLDVGRTHRLFTPKQHTALTERDRHCTWPGCTAPAAWTDAHHLTPWHARRTHRPDQRRPTLRTPPPPRPRHQHHRPSHRRPRPLGHRTATGAARAATRSARAPATGCHRPHHPHHRPPAAAVDGALAAAHPQTRVSDTAEPHGDAATCACATASRRRRATGTGPCRCRGTGTPCHRGSWRRGRRDRRRCRPAPRR